MTRYLPLAAALALLLLVTFVVSEAGAQTSAAFLVSDVQLIASDRNGLTVEVTVPQPLRSRVPSDTLDREQLELEGYLTGPDGLPIRDILVGLPPSGEVSLVAEPLAPAQQLAGPSPVARQPEAIQEYEGLALQAGWQLGPLPDEPRTLPLASLVDTGFFRDHRVGRIRLAPLGYLGDGRWQYVPQFRITMDFHEPAAARQPASLSAFSELLEDSLINGAEARSWALARPSMPAVSPTNLPENTWRIPITSDGLYRISYEKLSQNGVLASNPLPSHVHLLWRGQPVALQEVGMQDGTIDSGDSFLFYAEKFHGSVQDEKYTDENVYWLILDSDPGNPGLRMGERSVAPGDPDPAATWYTATVRTEENNYYWARWSTNPGTDATWFWERIVATQPVTKEYPITLNNPDAQPYDAVLHVELAARNSSIAFPDHHVRLSINDTPVGEDTWEGKVGRVITLPVSPTYLLDGENQIGVTLLTDVGTQDVYFDFAEISLRRQTIAHDNQLPFAAPFDGDAAYSLGGFTSNQIRLYNLANSLTPIVLTDTTTSSNGPNWKLDFNDSGSVAEPYLAIADLAIQDVPALTAYQPALELLSDNIGADEIIITPGAFYNAVLPLAAHRQAEGLRVQVVRVEDIYPLFNGGVFHPKAIRDFFAYAYQNWQGEAPAYGLLVGDGHFNFKGYNPENYGEFTPVYIPPFLDFVDPWQGEVPVDTRFVQIVGDDKLPDIALGRIPANSLQEVSDAVSKIIAYETQLEAPWGDQLLFVADNIPDGGGDFEGVLDRLRADYVPDWMTEEQVYLTDYCGPPANPPVPCPAATQDLIDIWSQGAAMLTFLGHGSIHRWTHEPLLLNTQIASLQPNHGLPFVMTLNCLDGFWALPPKYPGLDNPRSMAETMLMASDRGSIANFSPTGLGTTPAEEVIARNMYSAMFDDGERRLGEISLVGQMTSISFPAHLPEVSSLFGDPAGRLRMDSGIQQLTVEPKVQNGSALAGDFAVYHFRVTNEGNVPDSAALETTGNTWPLELSITQTEDLQPDAWVTVIVTASVPVDAARGDSDSATLNVVSESDPSVQDSAIMVTTAFAEAGPIYLPGIYRKTGNPFTEWAHSP